MTDVYLLGGAQTDFARNWNREGLDIYAMFREVLEQAKAAGQLDPAVDPEQTAEFIFNAWEGTLMRMKADKSRAPLDAFLALLPRLLGEGASATG